jgi:hypothetical protein
MSDLAERPQPQLLPTPEAAESTEATEVLEAASAPTPEAAESKDHPQND